MQLRKKAALLGAAWAIACGGAMAAPRTAHQDGPKPTADAQEMAHWVQDTGDAAGRPFLVVDKKAAQLFVYSPDGRLQAATPVLLGAARGDSGVPGVGDRAQSGSLPFQERTTPAGRFVTQPGRNLQGEPVVWMDYEAALAIHRLRPGRSHSMRAARLAHSRPEDRRLSLGCVVVPVAFFLDVVQPLLGRQSGVVYVLPETQSTHELITSM